MFPNILFNNFLDFSKNVTIFAVSFGEMDDNIEESE